MKLSTNDIGVLASIALRGDETMRESARAIGREFYMVQRAIRRATDAGLLRRLWVIEPEVFGLTRMQCLISVAFERKGAREKFITLLQASPDVSFLAEIGGDYEFEVVFTVENAVAAMKSLEALLQRAGAALRKKSIARQYRFAFFRRKYLLPPGMLKVDEPLVQVGGGQMIGPVDDTDRHILTVLIRRPGALKGDIAEEVGISPVTLERRMTRMRQERVIAGALWYLNCEELGYQRFKMIVTLSVASDADRKAIFAFAARHPYIANYRENVGDCDVDFGVEVGEIGALLTLREEFMRKFSKHVQTITTVPRFNIQKFEPFPLARLSPSSGG